MIDTIHLLPPDIGPGSNPVLFGIATALAEMLPLGLSLPSAEAPRLPSVRSAGSDRAVEGPHRSASARDA